MPAKVKNIAKGEVLVDMDHIINLEKRIEDQHQTIGAQKEQVNGLNTEIRRIGNENSKELKRVQTEFSEKEEKLGKEVRIITGSESNIKSNKVRCNNCGYTYQKNNYSLGCPSCDLSTSSSTPINDMSIDASITYKNLDDTVELIRTEESKKLKTDTHKLDQEIQDLTLAKDKLYKENGRFKTQKEQMAKDHAIDITEAKTDVRKRFQTQLDSKEDKIADLYKEIDNLKDNNTDELIEANRAQEIIDLKEQITGLANELAEIEKASATMRSMKAWFEKRRKERLEKEAMVEEQDRKDRVEEISNNYPSSKKAWDTTKVGEKTIRNPFKKGWWNSKDDHLPSIMWG
jgi:hypothetical protein